MKRFNHTAAAVSTSWAQFDDLSVTAQDRATLRELAKRLAELANSAEMEEKKADWIRHNDLQTSRPMIFCDPELGWCEIIPDESLSCEGDLARDWEMRLRKEIYYAAEMKDDKVITATFPILYCATETDYGLTVVMEKPDQVNGAYHWDAPLKDYDTDFEKLRFPEITVDYIKTERLYNLAQEIFGDILRVYKQGNWWWSLGMTSTLVQLRGLETIMYDMYDYPDELHRLMAFLRDANLARLDFLEKHNLLSLNNDQSYVGSGGFGWTNQLPGKDFNPDHVTTMDMWGFTESQETNMISEDMFAEFVFPYQLEIAKRFGLNCYGCCEPLNGRWNTVKQIPNLRRVSVSPWADLDLMAEMLGKDYVLSYKPNPSALAMPAVNEADIRAGLRHAREVAGKNNCHLEVIMKDNSTLGKDAGRAARWCRIAREELLG